MAALLWGCAEEAPIRQEVVRPVRWVEVELQDGLRERSFSGSAKSATFARLSFKVSGTVANVAVQVGDQVTAGQLIAELDPRDYELQEQEAAAALLDAQAQSREASANYDRYRLLYEADNTSKRDLDAARAADESAAAAVTAALKRLEIAQLRLSYTRLSAPVDGAIASKLVDVNENVGQGEGIVELTSGARIEVEIAVPEVLINQVQTGSSCVVGFDALPGQLLPATVIEVGVSSAAEQTAFPVTIQLDDAVDGLLPGMAAVVRLQLGDPNREPLALVPAVAVGEDRAGRFVWVVLDDGPDRGRVERREVEIGDLQAGGELEVLTGLATGDRVVIRGLSKLNEGMAVRLPESGMGN
jgi:RND family efflux transporter MFP subunit